MEAEAVREGIRLVHALEVINLVKELVDKKLLVFVNKLKSLGFFR
jgi:hypothetical protein